MVAIPIWIPQIELRRSARRCLSSRWSMNASPCCAAASRATWRASRNATRAAISPKTSEDEPQAHLVRCPARQRAPPRAAARHWRGCSTRQPAAVHPAAAARRRRVDRDGAGDRGLDRPGVLRAAPGRDATCSSRSGRPRRAGSWRRCRCSSGWARSCFALACLRRCSTGWRRGCTRVPGRLMHTTILGCGIFGSVSGSSSATCATIAKVALPELEEARLRREPRAWFARRGRQASASSSRRRSRWWCMRWRRTPA